MAIQNRLTSTLHCDGCGCVLNDGEVYRSAQEARRAGAEAGWWFPPRVTATGKISARFISDVCPECAATWRLRRSGGSRFIPLSEDAQA